LGLIARGMRDGDIASALSVCQHTVHRHVSNMGSRNGAGLSQARPPSWAVNQRAIHRGHGIRTGLEDTPGLPDGRQAQGNGDLIAAAAAMQRRRLATS
jgi:uncharacterized protein (DUF849 family)